jgi:hypothetical protein
MEPLGRMVSFDMDEHQLFIQVVKARKLKIMGLLSDYYEGATISIRQLPIFLIELQKLKFDSALTPILIKLNQLEQLARDALKENQPIVVLPD